MVESIRACGRCGYKGTDLESAHMLSYYLAKIIIVRQMLEPKTDEEHKTIDDIVKRVRGVKGEVYLCKPCHEYSNNEQKIMETVLKNIQK